MVWSHSILRSLNFFFKLNRIFVFVGGDGYPLDRLDSVDTACS